MRLTEQEITSIRSVFERWPDTTTQGSLSLFGSRTDMQKRGGDIDLLFIANDLAVLNQIRALKLDILVELKKQIGDQKIDLLLIDVEEAKTDPFVQSILPESIKLF